MKSMDKCPCSSFLVLLCLSSIQVIFAANYVPAEKTLLDCGANSDLTDSDGRQWTSDKGSSFLSSSEKSSTATASTQDPGVSQVPYLTARIFRSSFTYTFPVVSGHKFVRLYFYPSSYSGLNASDALFSVTAGSYTLLSNFSVAQTADALNYVSIMKEYLLNVNGGILNITFSPSSNPSSAYAFVNGIEIVSMPDIYSNPDGVTIVGQGVPFIIDNATALEDVLRLNVGGNSITPSGDTGLFRSWSDDQMYLYAAAFGVPQSADPNVKIRYPSAMPSYIAPDNVYLTARSMGPDSNVNLNYNLTWIFTVDSGFNYLVRLHFCEVSNITKINQRVFDIFLNNQTAEEAADVIAWAGGDGNNGVPVVRNYVVIVPGGPPQQDMWLALHPNQKLKPQYYDSILNGVEIFKISSPNGNLAGPNPIPAPKQDIIDPSRARPASGSGHSKSQTAIIAGGVSVGVVLAIVIGFCVLVASRRHRKGKETSSSDGPSGWLPLSLYGNSHSAGSAKTNTTGSYASSLPSNLCRHFSFAEIKSATNNFDEALLLGVGGFGKVYQGEIDGGTTKVAIKRGNPLSEQGVHEFQTEIEMLSKLRHRHLVSLIGYCEENTEMILVYDYMAHGTLPLNPTLPKEQVSLAEWAAHCHKKDILDQILDPYLKGRIAPECFKKFAETAMKCVSDQSIDRPSMGDVLWNLEFALQLQESVEDGGKGIVGADDAEVPFNVAYKGKKEPDASPGYDGIVTDSRSSGISMSIGGRSLASEDSDGLTPSAVFSQIMNPKGR
ncbi:hypothetical protein SADUNF_Sadunf04G0163900 [Salix dunnii]|uniref:Protein kinase domain-containing protein n=1 Tax=Salix dunnii TaxID=1413687 RepID=A0A835N1C8_9ROSI|nr:hypothetical protein SADUNF_Sadunf04G0163900 [Salix dunnii]